MRDLTMSMLEEMRVFNINLRSRLAAWSLEDLLP